MNVESAISDALAAGRALCKFISPNDAGVTGTHQCGFYLPKAAWSLFAAFGPVKGRNDEATVEIRWPAAITTQSKVKWYGSKTRSEYRLTCFGRDFPWLTASSVGALLVLVPESLSSFKAHILETDEEIELLQSSLGIEVFNEWAVYDGAASAESLDDCLDRVFKATAAGFTDFPPGVTMATWARNAAQECHATLRHKDADEQLMAWIDVEYRFFRLLESRFYGETVRGPFADIDAFIKIAATIMNRRKSRAGHSLEQHVEYLLKARGIPFDPQPRIDGKSQPDILIPGKSAYESTTFSLDRLAVLALKTTCKDRWRQILNEAKRIPDKHLLTLQPSVSRDQLIEMRDARVRLVVPKQHHKGYDTTTGVTLMSVESFLQDYAPKAA